MSGCGLNRNVGFWGWLRLVFWGGVKDSSLSVRSGFRTGLPGFRCVPITPACGVRAGCPRPAGGGRLSRSGRWPAVGTGQRLRVSGRGAAGNRCGYRASGRAAGRPHGCIQIVQRELG